MEQQATGKRAATYARVSSEPAGGRGVGESLSEQARDIEAHAAERGYAIVTHRYQDVESGVSRTRPGFLRLQADAKAGAVRRGAGVEV